MLSAFMISRPRGVSHLAATLAAATVLTISCSKVPLLAPSGSTITLTATATALSLNATADLIAQVVEASGTAPQDGTLVTFTTTLGAIQPTSAQTSGGRVVVKFLAGTASGTATIVATSGGASVGSTGAVKIAVGTAAVGRVVVSANPTFVPALGGKSTISTVVLDINGNPLTSAPVSFSTTAGSLSDVVVLTDANGLAVTTLQTTTTATVTASVGATGGTTTPTTPPTGTTPPATGGTAGQASGTVTVSVAAAPTLVITPPTTPPTAGLPASFTFAVTVAGTNGTPVRDVSVNWGDSQNQDLGAVTGSAVISHTYRSTGSYVISAQVTDSFGNTVPVSTTVVVNPASLPITITPPTTAPNAGLPAIFTIVVGTLPTGDVVRNVHVDWGDSSTQDLGAISGSTSVSHVYLNAGSYAVSAVLTDTAGNSSSVATAVAVVATASPTIIITPPSVPAAVTLPFSATFTIQVTVPSGVGVTDALMNFGDGNSQDLGGLNGTTTVAHSYSSTGTFTVTLKVTDTLGRTTTGSTTITIP
jgi:hypothetical protein